MTGDPVDAGCAVLVEAVEVVEAVEAVAPVFFR
jgi:hypothetical protein